LPPKTKGKIMHFVFMPMLAVTAMGIASSGAAVIVLLTVAAVVMSK
jgi:hypothetical protein